MKISLLTLTLALASTACAANVSTTNEYYRLDNSGAYPSITKINKETACDEKQQPATSAYKPSLVSLYKDDCTDGTIHPQAITLIKNKTLPDSKLVSDAE